MNTDASCVAASAYAGFEGVIEDSVDGPVEFRRVFRVPQAGVYPDSEYPVVADDLTEGGPHPLGVVLKEVYEADPPQAVGIRLDRAHRVLRSRALPDRTVAS